ncbi:MAG TPA: alpha-amylase/4-alpha-glucanotransferase domain-containing protein [bacterium]|nr:alpha-amylase/4-alpha-glucanotransferase domain-containing protein [bacterium]
MHRLALSLALHNHQPVGNFGHVFADATERSYAPMIAALERHPGIRVALHYSGPLLDWFHAHRPDLIARLRALVARGQTEMLTGAYYEAILPIVPDADKRGQILKMTHAIRNEFGYAADGLWLAERVWEPHLARPLGEAGVQYTIVDDSHFHAVGLEDRQLLGYYVTEEEGVSVALFPSLRRLRYLIPWVSPDEVIAYLRTLAETDVRPEGREAPLDLALMGDDGEKFGMWPTTYAHCWERGWVDRFFDALEATPWIDLVPPGDYRRTHEPSGAIYLPTATYDEMAEWALPPTRAEARANLRHDLETGGRADLTSLVRGGFWRHFLVRYPEANTLHHLALRAGRKVRAMPPGPDRERALDDLWSGECNCTYWHGVFGGIYLPHIRGAAFAHLIAAEAEADRVRHPEPYAEASAGDLNGDGQPELYLATGLDVCTVDPARGGSIVEWDDRSAKRHLGNVLTRRAEAYHARVRHEAPPLEGAVSIHEAGDRPKEPGLERLLVYDRVRRTTLRTWLWPAEVTRDEVWRDAAEDLGGFGTAPYGWRLEETPDGAAAVLTRRARVDEGDVVLERRIVLEARTRGLRHAVRLVWEGPGVLRAVLAEQWSLGLFGGPDQVWAGAGEDSRVSLWETAELPRAAVVRAGETYSGLTLAFTPERAADVWTLPVFTISNSESGFERNQQGAMLVLRWEIAVPAGTPWEQTTRAGVADGLRASDGRDD